MTMISTKMVAEITEIVVKFLNFFQVEYRAAVFPSLSKYKDVRV